MVDKVLKQCDKILDGEKGGKNLYGNYHEIEHSSKEYLSLKHESRASLGGTIWE